jgi:membrane associated rhomboid family serine protease
MFPLKDNIPLARFPLVTVALVAINAVVYLLEIRHGGSFLQGPSPGVAVHYGAIPYEVTHPGRYCYLVPVHALEGIDSTVACQRLSGASQVLPVLSRLPAQPATWKTAFTSMFLQGSFLAIFGNMIFLAIFGPTVEDSMGRASFLLFYLLGGLIALGTLVLVHPDSTVPTLGASGAIAAVLGGYIVLYPRARILSLVLVIFIVTLVEVPALALVGFWFVMQLVFSVAGLAGPVAGGEVVAYLAQIAAFGFGMLVIRLLASTDRGSAGRPEPPPLPVY